MGRLEVRLPDDELERWRAAADVRGWSLATLVRRGVAGLLSVAGELPSLPAPGPVVPASTVAAEAAVSAARLPNPAPVVAPPARGRVPAAETVCVHRVRAGAYCRKCRKQVGT